MKNQKNVVNKNVKIETPPIENPVLETEKKSDSKKIDYIIDATNVCSWHVANVINLEHSSNALGTFSLQPLFKLMIHLLQEGNTVQCIFDANTIYHLHGEEKQMYNSLLTDYRDFFYQVIGGIKADDFVLNLASRFSSSVISNDNFNEYHTSYPWLQREARPQRLFKGGTPIIGGDKLLLIPDLSINLVLDQNPEDLFKMLTGLLLSRSKRLVGVVKSYDHKNGKGLITHAKSEFSFSHKDIVITAGLEIEFSLDKVNTHIVATEIKVLQKEVTASVEEIEKLRKELDSLKSQNLGEKYHGVIDWYDHIKNYGAIKQKDNDETVFFFGNGFEHKDISPEKEMEVIYEKRINKKGPYAVDIRLETISKFINGNASADLPATQDEQSQVLQRDLDKLKIELNKSALLLEQLQIVNSGIIELTDGKIGVVRDEKTGLKFPFNHSITPPKAKITLKAEDKILFKLKYVSNSWYAVDLQMEKSAVVAPEASNLPPASLSTTDPVTVLVATPAPSKASKNSRKVKKKNQKLSNAKQNNASELEPSPNLVVPAEEPVGPQEATATHQSITNVVDALSKMETKETQVLDATIENKPATAPSKFKKSKTFFKSKATTNNNGTGHTNNANANSAIKKITEQKGKKTNLVKPTLNGAKK